MSSIPTLVLFALAAGDGELPVASARMQAEPLAPGQPLELVVRIDGGPERWWGDPADVRIARPILQVDAPESVKLLGAPPEEWVTPHDFETNYLRFPYGRKLSELETSIPFELVAAPEPGARIGLNLVYWLDNGNKEEARFVRRRLELEVAPGAKAVEGDPARTSWGAHETLAVGEQADAFVLPSHDGIEVGLEDYRGAPVLIFTYRAHW